MEKGLIKCGKKTMEGMSRYGRRGEGREITLSGLSYYPQFRFIVVVIVMIIVIIAVIIRISVVVGIVIAVIVIITIRIVVGIVVVVVIRRIIVANCYSLNQLFAPLGKERGEWMYFG